MGETKSHKRAKSKAPGQNEQAISGNRRVDSLSVKTATEVERSGDPKLLAKAVRRLQATKKPQKVLVVPNPDIAEAVKAMKRNRVQGTVKNLSGTKRRSVQSR